jgi:hypothetical protein
VYRAKQPDRALALLLTLYERKPDHPGLPAAVEKIAGEKIEAYLRDSDYVSARRVLDLWQKQFENIAVQSAAAWQQRFESAASKQLADANQLIARKDYISARRAVGRALAIWPRLPAAQQVLARIERDYRFVTVGVFETTPLDPKRRIDDWASIRASTLTERLLAEETDFGADGGTYTSPFGDWSLDETGRVLKLQLRPETSASLSTDALARYILSLAAPNNPAYRGDLASWVSGVAIDDGNSIVINLRRSHVRPESLLQVPPPVAAATSFAIAEYSTEQVVFASRLTTPGGESPQAIVEHQQIDDESAVAALIAGEIDILDRVPPWHLERMRSADNIQVDRYKLPTVHVLIANLKNNLLGRREFRRALCFGIDRKTIVNRVLLAGKTEPGFEVISGPFPVGTSLNDPIRYAYNAQIAPRPFEPRLASILATIAWANVQKPQVPDGQPADKGKSASVEPVDATIPELTLAHPSDPVARLACQSIQTQLTREGIPIKLVEFTAEELADGKVDCDLRYAELAVWEPIADAETILGQQGLAGDLHSSYLESALRELETAASWKDVRTRMSLVHEIASHELPVIPLWQTVNFFAYRKSLSGIGDSPMTLYQNALQWSKATRPNVAQASATQSR